MKGERQCRRSGVIRRDIRGVRTLARVLRIGSVDTLQWNNDFFLPFYGTIIIIIVLYILITYDITI